MSDGKIHITARKRKPAPEGQPIIRLTEDAYNVWIDIYNESQLSMKQIASVIIMQSRDLIVYDKEDE